MVLTYVGIHQSIYEGGRFARRRKWLIKNDDRPEADVMPASVNAK